MQIPTGGQVVLINFIHHLPEEAAVLDQIRPVLEKPAAYQEYHFLTVSADHFRDSLKAHTAAGRGEDRFQISHGRFRCQHNFPAFLPTERKPAAEVRKNRDIRSCQAGKLTEENTMRYAVPAGHKASLESRMGQDGQVDCVVVHKLRA